LTVQDHTVTTSPRALPFVLVGLFAILVVGGIALSLSSAPPLDEQELHNAATATMAASGFALVVTTSITSPSSSASSPERGPSAGTAIVRVLYQAPDSVQESEVGSDGQTASVILIGARRFQRSGSQWIELSPSPGAGNQVVTTLLSPLQAASDSTVVSRRGDLYRFVPRDIDRFLTTALGVRPSQVSSPRLTAVTRGDFLTHERITARLGPRQLTVALAFSAIGSAPPVKAPPSSSLVPRATSGITTTP
jgi:hypothetical protein